MQELNSFSGFKDGYEVAENVVVKNSTGAKDVSYAECYYLSSEGKLDIPPFKEGKFYVITRNKGTLVNSTAQEMPFFTVEEVVNFEKRIRDNI